MNAEQRAARLAQALADPLRLALLQFLMAGPAVVADLVAATGASQPKVSNHLAVLRAEGLVRSERQGRQMAYQIGDATVARLIEALSAVAGPGPRLSRHVAPLAAGRTCYDHLAGSLGVAVFDALAATGALTAPDAASLPATLGPSGAVTLGPTAQAIFSDLGIDIVVAGQARRQFAYACRDWTERRFHLGGALGAALYQRFVAAGWVTREPGTRLVRVTPAGARTLHQLFGLTVASADQVD